MRSGLTAAVMLVAALAAGGAGGARADEAAPKGPLPQGAGLAARYMRDAGVEGDPAVIFHDGFESGGTSKWNRGYAQKKFSRITREVENVNSGACALEWEVAAGRDTGGNLGYRFKKGYDAMYMRWYQKFAADFDQDKLTHTGAGIAGCAPGVGVPGGAGKKPNGRDKFCTALDPWRDWGKNPSPGELMLYTYHPDQGGRWGANLRPKNKTIPKLGRWYCYEIMAEGNTPGQKNGRVAIWADGRLLEEFGNLRLRDVESLKCNKIWLVVYLHNSKQTNKAWFDDVVVATKYIGPMQVEPPKPEKPVASKGTGPAPDPSDRKASSGRAEKEAGRLFQMARRAERMGQRAVAESLYRQIIEKHSETQAAKKAKEKLE